MKSILSILFLFAFVSAHAQTEEANLRATMKKFHQALVSQDKALINQQTDNALTFGHSNGWIQTKTDLVNDFETGLISYQSFKEDSVQISMGDGIANIRFIGDIGATLRGNSNSNHLKVLEVWIKKGKGWVLFARQAVR